MIERNPRGWGFEIQDPKAPITPQQQQKFIEAVEAILPAFEVDSLATEYARASGEPEQNIPESAYLECYILGSRMLLFGDEWEDGSRSIRFMIQLGKSLDEKFEQVKTIEYNVDYYKAGESLGNPSYDERIDIFEKESGRLVRDKVRQLMAQEHESGVYKGTWRKELDKIRALKEATGEYVFTQERFVAAIRAIELFTAARAFETNMEEYTCWLGEEFDLEEPGE